MSSVNIRLVEYELDCKDKKRWWRVETWPKKGDNSGNNNRD
jgi:hypothetical protein